MSAELGGILEASVWSVCEAQGPRPRLHGQPNSPAPPDDVWACNFQAAAATALNPGLPQQLGDGLERGQSESQKCLPIPSTQHFKR